MTTSFQRFLFPAANLANRSNEVEIKKFTKALQALKAQKEDPSLTIDTPIPDDHRVNYFRGETLFSLAYIQSASPNPVMIQCLIDAEANPAAAKVGRVSALTRLVTRETAQVSALIDGLKTKYFGQPEKLQAILNRADGNGNPALIVAARGVIKNNAAVSKANLETIKLLVSAGANINVRDARGYSAFGNALDRGQAEVAEYFAKEHNYIETYLREEDFEPLIKLTKEALKAGVSAANKLIFTEILKSLKAKQHTFNLLKSHAFKSARIDKKRKQKQAKPTAEDVPPPSKRVKKNLRSQRETFVSKPTSSSSSSSSSSSTTSELNASASVPIPLPSTAVISHALKRTQALPKKPSPVSSKHGPNGLDVLAQVATANLPSSSNLQPTLPGQLPLPTIGTFFIDSPGSYFDIIANEDIRNALLSITQPAVTTLVTLLNPGNRGKTLDPHLLFQVFEKLNDLPVTETVGRYGNGVIMATLLLHKCKKIGIDVGKQAVDYVTDLQISEPERALKFAQFACDAALIPMSRKIVELQEKLHKKAPAL